MRDGPHGMTTRARQLLGVSSPIAGNPKQELATERDQSALPCDMEGQLNV